MIRKHSLLSQAAPTVKRPWPGTQLFNICIGRDQGHQMPTSVQYNRDVTIGNICTITHSLATGVQWTARPCDSEQLAPVTVNSSPLWQQTARPCDSKQLAPVTVNSSPLWQSTARPCDSQQFSQTYSRMLAQVYSQKLYMYGTLASSPVLSITSLPRWTVTSLPNV
jgi:hypothetical protein